MAKSGPPDEVEEAVAQLCVALYRLQEAGKHQEAYDTMGTIISLMTEDRMHLLRSGRVKT